MIRGMQRLSYRILLPLCVAAFAGITVASSPRTARAPRALHFEVADRWTEAVGLGAILTEAGFDAAAIDPEAPLALDGVDLIAFGSFCTESPAYAPLVEREAAALHAFMERGGVVLQMTQADQTEQAPAWLPDGLTYRREDPDMGPVEALDAEREHPLVRGLDLAALNRIRHFERPVSWETPGPCGGFEVLLGTAPVTRNPALVEAAVGEGRLLLTSLFLDKLESPDGESIAPEGYRAQALGFFRGLREHVAAVRAGEATDVTVTPRYEEPPPLPFVEGTWTIAVLPDTQVYAMRHPEHFAAQTRWIAEHREERDIRFVLHLGDVTNNNNEEQWTHARAAMETLNGEVDYAIAPGNHDYGPNGNAADRTTLFNDFFPYEEQASRDTFGGAFEEGVLDNTWHEFEVADTPWLVLALEWGPREGAVAWANEVMAAHPDHRAILITHAYMYFDESRYDWEERGRDQSWNPHAYGTAEQPGGVHDGQELWDGLVSKHAGFHMTLNGHVLGDGLGRMSSKGAGDHDVHQMLVNYQMKREGGEGFMRLLEFLPDGETVQVRAWSPVTGEHRTDPQNQFTLHVPWR